MSTEQVQASRKHQTGSFGEQIAADYLQRTLGWRVLHQNWRCRAGELDIVAHDREALVVVEVRTRESLQAGSALESVDLRKQRQLLRLTQWLVLDPVVRRMTSSPYDAAVRIDVIALFLSSHVVTHFV